MANQDVGAGRDASVAGRDIISVTFNNDGAHIGMQAGTITMLAGELAGDSPYQAAQSALSGYEQLARQNEQAAETLEAQLTMHGFDRDQALMEQIRGLRESAGQIRAHAAQARQALADHHATGAEYHQSGTDANASAFRGLTRERQPRSTARH